MKTKKNEEYKESQITTMSIFGFTFFIKNYILLKNIVVKGKKVVYTILGYLKRSNDTPKFNIHKYNNYNIIEIYINRLSLTMQIFIAMDYLILMSEKYLHFRKWQMHVPGNFFSTRRSNWNHVPYETFFELCVFQRSVQKLKKIWNFYA